MIPNDDKFWLGFMAGRELVGRQLMLANGELSRVEATLGAVQALQDDSELWENSEVEGILQALRGWCPEFVSEVEDRETVSFLKGFRKATIDQSFG